MHLFFNLTMIYCLCEILLLLENLDTLCLSVEFLNLGPPGMSMYSLYVQLQINYEYITHVTFTTVTLREISKCYMREEILFNVKETESATMNIFRKIFFSF